MRASLRGVSKGLLRRLRPRAGDRHADLRAGLHRLRDGRGAGRPPAGRRVPDPVAAVHGVRADRQPGAEVPADDRRPGEGAGHLHRAGLRRAHGPGGASTPTTPTRCSPTRASRPSSRRRRPTPTGCSCRRSATTTRSSCSPRPPCSAPARRSPDADLGRSRSASAACTATGNDVTIVAVGHLVHDALAVAEELAGRGDLRRGLRPAHVSTRSTGTGCARRCSKTGRLVVFDDTNRTCGLAAEVLATAAEEFAAAGAAAARHARRRPDPVRRRARAGAAAVARAARRRGPRRARRGGGRLIDVHIPKMGMSTVEVEIVDVLVDGGRGRARGRGRRDRGRQGDPRGRGRRRRRGRRGARQRRPGVRGRRRRGAPRGGRRVSALGRGRGGDPSPPPRTACPRRLSTSRGEWQGLSDGWEAADTGLDDPPGSGDIGESARPADPPPGWAVKSACGRCSRA